MLTKVQDKTSALLQLFFMVAIKCCTEEFGICRILVLQVGPCEAEADLWFYVSHFFIPLFSSSAVIPTPLRKISRTRQIVNEVEDSGDSEFFCATSDGSNKDCSNAFFLCCTWQSAQHQGQIISQLFKWTYVDVHVIKGKLYSIIHESSSD